MSVPEDDGGTIDVMVNSCYGGFNFSKEAISIYRLRNPSAADMPCDAEPMLRHDAVMVEIVKELGAKVNGVCASIELHTIPAKFQKYHRIGNYDGMEHVEILHDRYWMDAALAILDDERLTHVERVKAARVALVKGVSK